MHNIRSTHNVGSLFRTADAVGVSKIYLVGYTPTPTDRFNRERKDIVKVSLGAEKSVPYEYAKTIGPVIKKLKAEGFKIVALEQDKESINYENYKPEENVALIVGSEVEGIPKSILKKCDMIIEILMKGKKESLNVSVAAGVALFSLIR